MRKNAFQALDHIKSLNDFKSSSNHPLSEEEFRNAFRECGIPSSALFFFEFKNSGVLVKTEKNTYVWRDKKPIHYSFLQKVYCKYQSRRNDYYQKWFNRKKDQEELHCPEIDNAIRILKEKGFVILAPEQGLYKFL